MTWEITVTVRMMCGCPLQPGGLWDADRVAVNAFVYDGDHLVREVGLRYAGVPNTFSGAVNVQIDSEEGTVMVVAADTARANFGVSAPFRISR